MSELFTNCILKERVKFLAEERQTSVVMSYFTESWRSLPVDVSETGSLDRMTPLGFLRMICVTLAVGGIPETFTLMTSFDPMLKTWLYSLIKTNSRNLSNCLAKRCLKMAEW